MNSSKTARECERDLKERQNCESVRENDEPRQKIRRFENARDDATYDSRIQISDELRRRRIETSNQTRLEKLRDDILIPIMIIQEPERSTIKARISENSTLQVLVNEKISQHESEIM